MLCCFEIYFVAERDVEQSSLAQKEVCGGVGCCRFLWENFLREVLQKKIKTVEGKKLAL